MYIILYGKKPKKKNTRKTQKKKNQRKKIKMIIYFNQYNINKTYKFIVYTYSRKFVNLIL